MEGYPVLLANKSVPVRTLNAINSLGVNVTIVVGGNLVIEEKVLANCSPKSIWFNRFDTAVELAKLF